MEINFAQAGFWALMIATFTLATTHTVSPDHWFPFVMVGRANKWKVSWVLLLALLAGIGHVGTSVIIGLVGVFAEKGASKEIALALEESTPWLLIIFGFGYAVYAFYKQRVGAHGHSHGIPILNKWLGIDPHAYALPHHEHGTQDHSHDEVAGIHIGPVNLYLHNMELHLTIGHDDHIHGYDATIEDDHNHKHYHADIVHGHEHKHTVKGLEHDHGNGHTHSYNKHTHGSSGIGEGHSHNHPSAAAKTFKNRRAGWGLVAILGLTPCIALLPLTFAAVKYGTMAVILVNISFAVGTLGTIVFFTWLGYLGLSWIKLEFFEEYGDVIAGAIIGLLGLATKIFAL
jgi:ABC-type nickel/cobalt efflux system permease component RcnA